MDSHRRPGVSRCSLNSGRRVHPRKIIGLRARSFHPGAYGFVHWASIINRGAIVGLAVVRYHRAPVGHGAFSDAVGCPFARVDDIECPGHQHADHPADPGCAETGPAELQQHAGCVQRRIVTPARSQEAEC